MSTISLNWTKKHPLAFRQFFTRVFGCPSPVMNKVPLHVKCWISKFIFIHLDGAAHTHPITNNLTLNILTWLTLAIPIQTFPGAAPSVGTIYIYSVDCTATYVKCALGCVYYRFRSKIICYQSINHRWNPVNQAYSLSVHLQNINTHTFFGRFSYISFSRNKVQSLVYNWIFISLPTSKRRTRNLHNDKKDSEGSVMSWSERLWVGDWQNTQYTGFFHIFSWNVCLGGFAGSEHSLSIACCAGRDPTARNSSAMIVIILSERLTCPLDWTSGHGPLRPLNLSGLCAVAATNTHATTRRAKVWPPTPGLEPGSHHRH